jgi:hypothetical protein
MMPISLRRANAAIRIVLATCRIAAISRNAATEIAPHFMTSIQK